MRASAGPTPPVSNVGPLNGQTNRSDFQNSPLYGLSEVFQVAAAVVVTNNPPTVANAIPDQSATAGTAFSYAFPANTFSDADTGDTLTYTATKADDTALPTWLAFAAGTRTFSGTPQAADAATVAVKVTASDGNGGSVSDTFDITVAADPNAHCNRHQRTLVRHPDGRRIAPSLMVITLSSHLAASRP